MRKIYHLLILAAILVIGNSCNKNDVSDPGWKPGDQPRIFDQKNVFQTPSHVINGGESVAFTGLLFSPAGQVKVSWKVDGKEVSTDTAFTFTPTTGGEFALTLEATYGGLASVRSTKVLVKPSTYEPKPFTKVALGYVTSGGSAASVNWDNVTHVSFLAGKVTTDGALDVSAGETNQRADEMVARGHIAGRRVLLGLTGRLSGVDGWALYEANDFGQAIYNDAARAILLNNIKNYVTAKGFDGVDLVMTDINSGLYAQNLSKLGTFINELRAALPANSLVTLTGGVGWQHWDYPNVSNADWVNVRAFEDPTFVGPGAPLGQASSYQYMLDKAAIWVNKVGASKVVVGIPAFGLRYLELDDNGNNASWGSYDYVPFKDIIALDNTAADKEMINSSKGIYFNGKPLVKQKADYIKAGAFKGAYLWAADYDAENGNSLMKVLNDALNK
ncbi:GH18 family chitinase [Chitinophaga skermanii]|uniref:chitinase n=1 Tax=Chitinophaga skermanii TaxID=331697 RepID=A0A327R5D8_9BACT|nr:glycosyl hydrolase family 18 protein [Chitinophaga skermanii]RAJ10914.1 GH18 family chitinase [Chitinophaga skermanii]